MNIIPFNFESKEIRVVEMDNEPWFVASDIASALEYRDAYDMTRILDDDEKGTHNLRTPGGEQLLSIINESGLYSAILRSRKPEAKAFKKWVTSDVLPSIRKTGSYQSKQFKIPATLSEALRLAADQAEQIEQQQFLIEQQKPAVEFVGKFVTADSGNMTFRAVAKILKINEREFRQFLSDNKIMYKLGGDWVPHQNHIEAGRFDVKAGLAEYDEKSHAFKQSKFTPRGVEWVAGEYAKSLVRDATKV